MNIFDLVDTKRRTFLNNQRRDGRVGYINNIPGLLDEMRENENRKQELLLSQRQAKSEMDFNTSG